MNFENVCGRGLVAIIFLVYVSSSFGATLLDKPCHVSSSRNVRITLAEELDSILGLDRSENFEAIIVPSGTQLRLKCLEKDGSIFRELGVQDDSLQFVCKNGKLVSKKGRADLLGPDYGLNCERESTKKETSNGELVRNGTCENQGINIDVKVTDPKTGKSSVLYSVCFDESTSTTLYSRNIFDGYEHSINKNKTKVDRPHFQDQGFFPFNVNKAYTQKGAGVTLEKLLGQEKFDEYFPDGYGTRALFLARGHLHANSDEIGVYKRMGTFFFVNVVPQWQVLNNGNWKAVEESFRDLGDTLKSDIKVWTGAYDVLALKGANEENVQLYLEPESKSGKPRLPVPKFLWKVGYSVKMNAAIALIQINNPFGKENEKDVLCKDICDQVPWLTGTLQKNRHSFGKGYTYCCDVNELRKRISTIPELKYDKILTNLREESLVQNIIGHFNETGDKIQEVVPVPGGEGSGPVEDDEVEDDDDDDEEEDDDDDETDDEDVKKVILTIPHK